MGRHHACRKNDRRVGRRWPFRHPTHADVVSQRTSKSGPPMRNASQAKSPAPLPATSLARPAAHAAAASASLPTQLRRTCSSAASPEPHHHDGRAAEEVGPRLRRRLRRPAPPLVGERPPLAGQLVVRVRAEGAQRGIRDARLQGPGELRPEEAPRGGVLQGHIPRERGGVAQAGRRCGLGGCVRRAGFAWLHGPPAIELLHEIQQRNGRINAYFSRSANIE